MKITEIAFSSYPVTDIVRSRAFYEGVLKLTPGMISESGGGKWVEYEIGPHTLSIGQMQGWNPSPDGCCVALEVENFVEAIDSVRAANMKFRMEPFETPGCHMAMILDPDGNTLIIHKRKPGHH